MSAPGTAEATAPCSVELAGGVFEATAVRVAIDRRVWSRVVMGGEGVHVESKDTLQKMSVGSVDEWIAGGRMLSVAQALRASGVETGVHVYLHARVPEGTGLGEGSALAVATAGAACGALGRPVDPEEVGRILSETRGGRGEGADQAALHGGTVAVFHEEEGAGTRALAVDPARLEESLLLVDSGSTRAGGEGGSDVAERKDGSAARGELAQIVRKLYDALIEARFEDVADLYAAEWEARKLRSSGATTPEIDAVVALVREAGGAARACGPGPGGLVAVWAPPGERSPGRREAVEAALGGAGLRIFPARVDLLGLDVA